MKGVIFFFIFEILKRGFCKKKSKKIKDVLRETEFKTEFPELRKPLFKILKMKKKLLLSLPYFRQNEKKIH